MPFGNESIIAGAYTATWNGVALGIFEGDSGLPTLSHQIMAQNIDNTSLYGRALIDAVFQGMAVSFQMVCMEYKAGTVAAAFPQNAVMGRMGTVGRLHYASLAAALVMTAVAGTPAAASPATLTAPKTCLAPGVDVSLAFGPVVRTVPLRLVSFLADVGGGNSGFFSTT